MYTYYHIADICEHDIIKRAHIILTSFKTKKTVHHRTEAPQKDLRLQHKKV